MDGEEERSMLAKVTLLRFIAALSFFSFLYSCFSSAGYNNINNIQFSTLFFSLFAHSLDRKYMFLICNGIVAFLVNTFTFSSSTSIKSAQDSVTQIVETTTLLVQENAASSVEYGVSTVATEEEMEKQQEEMKVEDEDEDGAVQENIGEEEINVEVKVEDESDYEEEEEEEEEKVEVEKEIEVSDAIVSTEELNHKFEEFIRKMKEEIRIEALQQQQQLVAAS